MSLVKLVVFLLPFFVIIGSAPIYAKDKRTTSVNFEDELIEGNIKKPELMYLLQKKQFNFKRLIKLRNHFRPEMYQTAEEIQGDGSNN